MTKDVLIGEPKDVKYYDVDVERAVLKCCITDRMSIATAQQLITADTFYLPIHRSVYTTVIECYNEIGRCDTLVLFNAMKKKGISLSIEEIRHILDVDGTTLIIGKYCLILKEMQLGRNLINATQNIANRLQSEKDSLSVLDKLEADIRLLRKSVTLNKSTDVASFIADYLHQLQNTKVEGQLKSGYHDLDNYLGGGFAKGELVILGGRPSMGKTALALNFLANFEKIGLRSLFFSLEMTKERITDRWVSMVGGLYGWKLQKREFAPSDTLAFQSVQAELQKWKMIVDDSASHTVDTIRAVSSLRADEHGLDIVLVDYLQLVNSAKGHSRENEVAQISRGLKALAKELDVCVIALSQLSRNVTEKADKRPQLNDLRDSGSIEQDADVVLFVHSDDYYNNNKPNDIWDSQIILSKNRNGAVGDVGVKFEKSLSKFRQVHNF